MMRIPDGVAFPTGIPGVSIDTRKPEKPAPLPIVRRCANVQCCNGVKAGCGRAISSNRIMCLACFTLMKARAAKKEPNGQTDSSHA
jgi:hypothetical protein